MPTFKYDKIVRDKIYDTIVSAGGQAVKKDLTPKQLVNALKDKLVEEAFEVQGATHPLDLTEELADVMDVIHGLSKAVGISMEAIEDKRLSKRQERGGFENGVYIKHATFDKDHEITKYCRDRPEKYPESSSG